MFLLQSKYRRIHFGDSDEEESASQREGLSNQGTQEERNNLTTPLNEVFGASDDEDDSLLETESITGRSSGMKDPFPEEEDVSYDRHSFIVT